MNPDENLCPVFFAHGLHNSTLDYPLPDNALYMVAKLEPDAEMIAGSRCAFPTNAMPIPPRTRTVIVDLIPFIRVSSYYMEYGITPLLHNLSACLINESTGNDNAHTCRENPCNGRNIKLHNVYPIKPFRY